MPLGSARVVFCREANQPSAPDPVRLTTTFDDPQWAFLQVGSTTHGGQAAPNAHCEIAIDGQVATSQDAPYSPQCFLSQW